jgi:hypothetical protein
MLDFSKRLFPSFSIFIDLKFVSNSLLVERMYSRDDRVDSKVLCVLCASKHKERPPGSINFGASGRVYRMLLEL